MSRIALPVVISSLMGLLAACSSLPTAHVPQEYLDERTGATVTMAAKPLVFASIRTERATNLRDYLTLVPASVNRAGSIQYVWIAYAWSTLDPLLVGKGETESLVITADDRRIVLLPVATTAAEAGISLPKRGPPGVSSISHVYRADLETMGLMATARGVRLQVGTGDSAPYFELWDDGLDSLAEFVRFAHGSNDKLPQ
jgi:hypothetical protein